MPIEQGGDYPMAVPGTDGVVYLSAPPPYEPGDLLTEPGEEALARLIDLA